MRPNQRAPLTSSVRRTDRRHVRSLGSPDEVAAAVGFAQKNRSHPVVADNLPAAGVLVEQSGKRWVAEAGSATVRQISTSPSRTGRLARVDQRECEFPSWPFGCVHGESRQLTLT